MKNDLNKALEIAKDVHRYQKDKAGVDYINHPLTVSRTVKGKKAKIVALLHDTIEDGDITLDYLKQFFTDDICYAVDCLTKKRDVSYEQYISRIKDCELARVVKIADLKHNMDITRLSHLNESDLERLNKYLKSFNYLKEIKKD